MCLCIVYVQSVIALLLERERPWVDVYMRYPRLRAQRFPVEGNRWRGFQLEFCCELLDHDLLVVFRAALGLLRFLLGRVVLLRVAASIVDYLARQGNHGQGEAEEGGNEDSTYKFTEILDLIKRSKFI